MINIFRKSLRDLKLELLIVNEAVSIRRTIIEESKEVDISIIDDYDSLYKRKVNLEYKIETYFK